MKDRMQDSWKKNRSAAERTINENKNDNQS